jgi:type I restriction enzyme S subunit
MNDVMATINIPLPPLAEQRKIAEILRTWDEAIETAEAELKAKKERKSWLMQKLLTCPKQLEGALHQNAWTTVALGDVASFQNGEAFSSEYFNSEKLGLRLIRNRDLKNDDQVIFYNGEYSDKDIVNNGDLLVGMDGDFTPVIWSKGKALLNQRVGRIDVKPETSQIYIYYSLYSVLTELEHVTSATTVKHLSSKGCLALKISLPPLDSQRLITCILQSADADIEVINHRIEALRAQKRGLMQKLLTGEVRVAA